MKTKQQIFVCKHISLISEKPKKKKKTELVALHSY